MTRYYFAGRYSRHAELAGYRDQLVMAVPGAEVTSRWIDCHNGELEASYTPEMLNADPAGCWRHGAADLADMAGVDAIVSFTGGGGGGKGGRHIEHGWALKQRAHDEYVVLTRGVLVALTRVVIVGPRENIFHCHPATEVYPTWPDFLRHEVEANGARLVRKLHPSIAPDV